MDTIVKLEYKVDGLDGKPVSFDLNYSPSAKNQPLVVFAHGFKGFKDWGTFNAIAERFVEAGFAFLKFNFSHNGVTPEQPLDFADLEAFGHNTLSKELNDFKVVFDWIDEHLKEDDAIAIDDIALIGFSRGGGIAIIEAYEEDRIKKLVTWASVSDFRSRFSEAQLQAWKEAGVLYIPNARTGQQMPLYKVLYDDFEANEERLTITKAAKQMKKPTLVVHGKVDETVNHQEAEAIASWIDGAQVHYIDNAGHTFNGKHPFDEETLPKETEELIEKTVAFLK